MWRNETSCGTYAHPKIVDISLQQLTAQVTTFILQMKGLVLGQPAASAGVMTQLTDVEGEGNGFITYDRQVWKVDPVQFRFFVEDYYRVMQYALPVLPSSGV